jgi:hypothetical protein
VSPLETFVKHLFTSSSEFAWKVLESLLTRLSLRAVFVLLTAVLSKIDSFSFSLPAVVAGSWVLDVSLDTKVIWSNASGGRGGGNPELITGGFVIGNALIPLKTCEFVRKIKRGKN